MKSFKKTLFIVLTICMICLMPFTSQAAAKKISKKAIKGTEYILTDVKKVSYKNNKLTLKCGFVRYHSNLKIKKYKTKSRTYKIARKIKAYTFEGDYIYDCGKLKTTKLVKCIKQRIKTGFPGIRIYVKGGRVIGYGLSS